MTYCCEDCQLMGYSAAGDDESIENFYSEHAGHNTHFNNFGVTNDGRNTLKMYIDRREKELRRHNHPINKVIRRLKGEYPLSDPKHQSAWRRFSQDS